MIDFNNFLRYLALKKITNYSGKVVEEEDKIICYVKKTSDEKECRTYYYRCYGIDDSNIDLANKYNINKPITYIFDELDYSKNKVVIFGYNGVNILIKNFKFKRELVLNNPTGTTILDNTVIKIFINLILTSSNLVFKNMDIGTRKDILYGKKINIFLNGDNVDVMNSKIGEAFEKNHINIDTTNKLSIVDSKISGEEIEIKSQELISNNSLILATEVLAIDSIKTSELNIKSPIILRNDDINQTKEELESKEKTRELLSLLKNIKNQCEVINNLKTEEYRNNLNKEEVSKVLKKSKERF